MLEAERTRATFILDKLLEPKRAKQVEIGIYNFSIEKFKNNKQDFPNIIEKHGKKHLLRMFYNNKTRTVLFNLRKYDSFLNKVKTNKIKARDIPYMYPGDVCSDCPTAKMNKYLIDRDRMFEERRKMEEAEELDSKGLYTCKKCRSSATYHKAVQTRSADEPMTIFITCLNCDNRWKE